jgi:hypothetical protein
MASGTFLIAANTDSGNWTGFDSDSEGAYASNTYLSPFRFDDGKGGVGALVANMRFSSVAIPQGATISSAKITLMAAGTGAGFVSRLRGALSTDYPALSSTYAWRGAHRSSPDWTTTTNTVDWTIPSLTLSTDYDTADITSIIQELVSQGGWASGNHIAIALEDTRVPSIGAAIYLHSRYTDYVIHSFSTHYDHAPRLYVEWTESAGGIAIPVLTQQYRKRWA